MLTKFKDKVTKTFLGEAVVETTEIHRASDEKFKVHIGLFRKDNFDTFWIKFVRKSLFTSSSDGIGIGVDNFSRFLVFLNQAKDNASAGTGIVQPIPFIPRMILSFTGGVRDTRLLSEYRNASKPKIVTRLYSLIDRKILFEHKILGKATYELIDLDVIEQIIDTIEGANVAEQGAASDPTVPV